MLICRRFRQRVGQLVEAGKLQARRAPRGGRNGRLLFRRLYVEYYAISRRDDPQYRAMRASRDLSVVDLCALPTSPKWSL